MFLPTPKATTASEALKSPPLIIKSYPFVNHKDLQGKDSCPEKVYLLYILKISIRQNPYISLRNVEFIYRHKESVGFVCCPSHLRGLRIALIVETDNCRKPTQWHIIIPMRG